MPSWKRDAQLLLRGAWKWYENPSYGKIKVPIEGTLSRVTQTAHKLGKSIPQVSLSKRAVSIKSNAGFFWYHKFSPRAWKYHPVKIRPKWEYIIIAFLLGLLLTGHRARVIPESTPRIPLLKPVEAVSVHLPKKQGKLAPIDLPTIITAPDSSYTPTGCSIWHSGNSTVDTLINRESGGNTCALNAGGCFGILQACPGEPLRAACGGDGACQYDWFYRIKLCNSTYNCSWAAALAHSYAYNWW